MTRKFKKTVKDYVQDGVLTPDEKAKLDELGKLEKESKLELEIYITRQLKKRKRKKAEGPGWWQKNSPALIGAVVTLGGPALKFYLDSKGKGK